MFSVLSVFAAVSLLSGLSSGQQLLDGPCSSFGVSDVNLFFPKHVIGKWFLYRTLDNGLPLHDYDCIRFYHKLNGATVETKETAKKITTDAHITSDSRLIFNTSGSGHYTYTYQQGDISQDTQVVDTDYLLYYIEFFCVDVNGKSDCYVAIFTREAYPNFFTVARIKKYLADHKIDRTKLRYVN